MDLTAAIDLHAHCAPDVRPRKMSALDLARQARSAGMRGLLLKNHHTPTTALASTLREVVSGIEIFGGLVLNEATGGFNPAAVEAALKMGAAEIWMPTLCAEQERAYRGSPGTGMRLTDSAGRVHPAVGEILRLVAEAGAILGSGHLSSAEIRELIRAGRDAGVGKFLITHPEIQFLNFPLAFQREIAGPGVYFERCYVRAGFALSWDELAHVIREVGVETTVLATDLGQPENPDPVSGFAEMGEQLSRRGFSDRELQIMMCDIPAFLLGLE
ncbi:MAG: DUF6282 family protein [Acidobacteria bacterium]|nr:DUF6282 family protein [Acidobacteriota bacterium]